MRRALVTAALLLSLTMSAEPNLAPAVSGAAFDGGLVLGRFTLKRLGEAPKAWPLTEPQLKKVSDWLGQHRSDIGLLVTSTPPPSFTILLLHYDGTRTQVDLFSGTGKFKGWKGAVVVRRTDPAENGAFQISDGEQQALLKWVSVQSR